MSFLYGCVIACGGALGALSRWRLDLFLRKALLALGTRKSTTRQKRSPAVSPLLGIAAVNVCGGFLLGMLGVLGDENAGHLLLRAFLITGFLGGFTTFSTAVMDCWNLWHAGRRWASGALLVGVWAACLFALAGGIELAQRLS